MQGGPFSLERLLLLLLGGAGVAAGGWLALEMSDVAVVLLVSQSLQGFGHGWHGHAQSTADAAGLQ